MRAAVAPTRRKLNDSRNVSSLACGAGAEIAHLVEEQRAAVGDLDQAELALARVGERAALVAEQLALDQRLGDRRRVELDERPGARARDA